MTLGELGERYLLQHVIPEYCKAAGDDCGRIPLSSVDLLVTTDPVPVPAAQVLANDPDPYWMGWLLVIINLSDLAAAGAVPLCFVSAIEAESSRDVLELRRLLSGIRDACESEGISYVGGNLREAGKLGGVGTAIGLCKHGLALNRGGARCGDLLLSIGAGGLFWRDALRIRLMGISPENRLSSSLFAPRSQARVMQQLAELRIVHAAIDNSDGLLPSVQQLLNASSLCGTLDLTSMLVPDATDLPVEEARLWMGWGDWNVIAAISESDLNEVIGVVKSLGGEATVIGKLQAGPPELFVRRSGAKSLAPRLESERFAQDSWFAQGIDSYVNRLLTLPLPD